MKRLTMVTMILLVVASTAWSKIKKDEQEYFDAQFEVLKAQIVKLQDENNSLNSQLAKVTEQLAALQKSQIEANELIHRDGGFLEEVNQSLRMNQMTHEQDYNTMKQIQLLLQNQQQQLAALSNGNAAQASAPVVAVAGAPPSAPAAVAQPAASAQVVPAVHFYIVLVEGDKYTLGLGTAQGVKIGAKVAVYKASAPAEKIGELEVTDIVDDNDCHARLASINPGVTIEANDIVQPQ